MNDAYIDTNELVRLAREVQGVAPISRFRRLVGDATGGGLPPQADTTVSWSLKGMADGRGKQFLLLRVSAAPTLECQRCLQPFQWPMDVETRLELVKSEADLDDSTDGLHEQDPEDFVERIVGSQRLDIMALVEDEIILGLPYVPKHEVCPSLPEALDQNAGADRPNPFAVLSQLKKD